MVAYNVSVPFNPYGRQYATCIEHRRGYLSHSLFKEADSNLMFGSTFKHQTNSYDVKPLPVVDYLALKKRGEGGNNHTASLVSMRPLLSDHGPVQI